MGAHAAGSRPAVGFRATGSGAHLPTIQLLKENATARLRFDRPERLNALSPALLRDLIDICGNLAGDESVKVVALDGVGGNFSAGADLPEFAEELAASPRETADLGRLAGEALANLPHVTIAIIRGHCIGGGLVLASACDLRVCDSDSRFSIPELEAGIPLAWGGMHHLVRLVGETTAADLVLSGRPFTADDALAAGFVSRVIEPQALDEVATQLVDVIAGRPRVALRITKRQLRAIRAGTFDPANDAAALVETLADPESRESLRTYTDRLR